jgi:hypothetical protein
METRCELMLDDEFELDSGIHFDFSSWMIATLIV